MFDETHSPDEGEEDDESCKDGSTTLLLSSEVPLPSETKL